MLDSFISTLIVFPLLWSLLLILHILKICVFQYFHENTNLTGDTANFYQLGFQDPATTVMEGMYLFNLHLLFIIVGIVLLVGCLLFVILTTFLETRNSTVTNFTHSNFIEIIWTSLYLTESVRD